MTTSDISLSRSRNIGGFKLRRALAVAAGMTAMAWASTALAVDPASLPGRDSHASSTDSTHAAGADSTIHPIRGFLPDLNFELAAAGGKTVTEEDFDGKIVMMFFGYASCPDICPTTMAQLSQVVATLGPDAADKVRIVFISVDPHRDTPEILQAYVDAFDSNAIGLTGTERQISRLARRYRVAYQIQEPPNDETTSYEVAHSRGIYIFDARGKARMLASDGESVEKLAGAVRQLLSET